MKYNQVYGRYCFGTGSWLGKKNSFKKSNLYSDYVIDSYKSVIKQDFLRIGEYRNLKKKIILDVGSGRNSIAFQKLGAKKIYHIDISSYNHKNLTSYLKNRNQKFIQSYNFNLEENEFKNLKINFNFVYLHGVIHHMKNPQKSLNNIDEKLYKDGLIWIHFYQYGSFSNICIKLIKKILSIKKIKIDVLYNFFIKKIKQPDLDVVIDTLGCDYIKTYRGDEILNFMKKKGYDLFFSKDVYFKNKCSIRTTTQSGILVFKKKSKNTLNIKNLKLSEFYYLDKNKFEKEDQELIKKINQLEKKFFRKLSKKSNLKKVLNIIKEIVIVWRNDKLLKPFIHKEKDLMKLFKKITKQL